MATSSHRHTKLRPDTQGKLRKGVCENHQYSNPDTGEVGDCPECASGKIQAVNIQRLSDFKCDVCGGRLTPVKNAFPTKPILLALSGFILLGALVLCSIWFGKDSSSQVPLPPRIIPVDSIIVSKAEHTLYIGDSTKITTKVIPSEATDTTVVWMTSNSNIVSVSDGKIKAIDEGQATITVKSNDGKASAIVIVNVTPKKEETPGYDMPKVPKRQHITEGCSFSGTLKNGYPHGHGVLTFKQRRRIDNHDEKGRIAEVGDYIQGEWNNGHLLMGHWFGNDNIEKEFINIGNALDPESDHSLYR